MEFGAKLSNSVVDGYTYMGDLSFNVYNEGTTLKDSIKRYKSRSGVYPQP